MRGPPPPDAYQQLKTRLLAAHTLTEFQRMDKLLSAQPFGGQKPSDLLHELVQFCPEGESQSKIFRYLFLQRLPAELRIILTLPCQYWRPERTSFGLTAPGGPTTPPPSTPLPRTAARRIQQWQLCWASLLDVAATVASPEAGAAAPLAAVEAVTRQRAPGRRQQRTRALPPGWPSRPPVCADITGGTATRRSTAASPAHGRETR